MEEENAVKHGRTVSSGPDPPQPRPDWPLRFLQIQWESSEVVGAPPTTVAVQCLSRFEKCLLFCP